jgi:hypothetical protein
MSGRIFLFVLLSISILATPFLAIGTVTASPYFIVDQPWGRATGINQPVEFHASGSGGTPPYTYQWYTTFLDPNVSPDQWVTNAVSGATGETFNFVALNSGRYGISTRIADANGQGEYQSFQPIGIVVTVESNPVTTSPAPEPQGPTVSFTLWHTDTPVIEPPADQLTHLPAVIRVESPQNQSVMQTKIVVFKVDVASYFWVIDYVYYEADWQVGRHQIFSVQSNYATALNASITVNFTDIPLGPHNVTFYATTNDASHSQANVFFTSNSDAKPTVSPIETSGNSDLSQTSLPTEKTVTIFPTIEIFAIIILFIAGTAASVFVAKKCLTATYKLRAITFSSCVEQLD